MQKCIQDVHNLRHELTATLRRKERNNKIKAFRNEANTIEGVIMVRERLFGQKTKQSWIQQKANNLNDIPCLSWKTTIEELFLSLPYWKDNVGFDLWIKTKTIARLCQIFGRKNQQSDFFFAVARLFSVIISLQRQQLAYSTVEQDILKQKILFELLQRWFESKSKKNQIHQLESLIDNLLVMDSENPIIEGGFTAFVDKVLTEIKQRRFNFNERDEIIRCSHFLALYLHKSKLRFKSKLHFYDLIFQILEDLVLLDESESAEIRILQIIEVIFRCEEESVYNSFIIRQNLSATVFKLSIHQSIKVRKLSWITLALISSYQSKAIAQLFQQNQFFDLLICAYHKYRFSPKNTLESERNLRDQEDELKKIKQKMLLCIGNLCDYGDQMRLSIIRNPIIKIIIESALGTDSDVLKNKFYKIKTNAYYALCKIVNTRDHQLFNQIAYELPIPDLLVAGLQAITSDDKIIQDILEALLHLMSMDQKLHKIKKTNLFSRLQEYNLSEIIYQIKSKEDYNFISSVINSIMKFNPRIETGI